MKGMGCTAFVAGYCDIDRFLVQGGSRWSELNGAHGAGLQRRPYKEDWPPCSGQ